MHTVWCLVNPVGCAATSLAKASIGDLFGALTAWVLMSVSWLLRATTAVLNAAGEPHAVVRAATPEFMTLATVSPVLVLVGVLVATLGALRRGDVMALWRSVGAAAPACVFAVVAARPLAVMVLTGVDQLCTVAAHSVGTGELALSRALVGLSIATTPSFGVFLLALVVIVGGFLLWCELVIRAVILSFLLVLVPVVVPLAVIPACRRVGWRLCETFVAVALSKFLIVVALALGLSELTSSSPTTVITGAVTLLLASATPFVLLRLIPMIEHSAVHGVDGLRQRASRAVAGAPSSPAGMAVGALAPDVAVPGPPERPDDLGIPMWEPGPDIEMPPLDGDPPPAPVGEPRRRTGHVAYYRDAGGPVVGWHFDE